MVNQELISTDTSELATQARAAYEQIEQNKEVPETIRQQARSTIEFLDRKATKPDLMNTL